MAYNPLTDFLALIRNGSGGAAMAEMPGLDYVVAAMARAGLIALSVGQTAPTTNQQTTVWLKPSLPSWVAEGTVFLWSATAGAYAPATPTLWANLMAPGGYSFQSAPAASNAIAAGASLVAVQRVAPVATALVLPSLLGQWQTGRPLRIVDWSTSVTNHALAILPSDSSTIMKQPLWDLLSTPDQLAGITLYPSPDLNGWIIAP